MDVTKLSDEQRRFFILKTAQRGDLRRLRLLVEDQDDVLGLLSTADEEGYTPLHRASYNGRLDVIHYLLLH